MEYLRQYTFKRYQNFTILYLAFHGRTNRIFVRNESVTLKEISSLLEGKLEGKFVHFGSCSTLRTTDGNISDFISNTKCNFISGYKKNVDYIGSTAFELLYLEVLQKYSLASKVESKITKDLCSLKKKFDFNIYK